MSARRRIWAAALALAAVAAGCGGDDDGDRVAKTAPAAAPIMTVTGTATEPTATVPAPPATTPTVPSEDQPGGAGDEMGNVAPVLLTVGGRELGDVSVPAFLSLAVGVQAADGRAHAIAIATTPRVALDVPASGAATEALEGQQPGRYAITVDGKRAGTLVAE